MDFITIGIIVGVVLFIGIFMFCCYVQAPPSEALILSGITKEPRTLIGTGGFKIPFLERKDKVYLGQVGVDIRTKEAVPTLDFINVSIDAVAKVQIIPNPDGVRLGAKNFLNLNASQIAAELQDTLEANMREIIGTIDLKSLNTNRDEFAKKVIQSAVKDMEQLGIKILCCNIQTITDENGLIKDLGADNTAKIQKDAAITKAISKKEVEIEQAKAEKEANDARVAADLEIAEKQNELELKKADLKKQQDTRKATADAAYEIEKQRQQKEINTATVDAEIEMTQRRQQLEEENIKVTENRLKSEINKKAEAEKFKTETNAAAELEQRKRIAEAEAYEAEQQAKAIKAKADADMYKLQKEAEGRKALAEAEAYQIAKTGESEAEAIRLKGEAEAAAMEKKAEAYKKYEGAAVVEMITKILPDVAANVAAPVGNIKDLRVYGGDASSVSGNVPALVKQSMDVIESTTGVKMGELIKDNSKVVSATLK